jgi:hypothetical protein
MKTRIPLAVALLSTTLSLPVFAYQFEVDAEYTDSETNFDNSFSPDIDEDSTSFSATYYFSDVETNKGPLSVAAFLNRASSISAFYSDGEAEVDRTEISFSGPAPMGGISSYGFTSGPTFFIPDYDIETEEYFVSAQYVHAESGWLVEASYGYLEEDSDLDIDLEQDIYGIGIGKYIAENTRLMLDYVHTETDIDVGVSSVSADSELVNLGLFHVQELGNNTYYDVSLDVANIDPDGGDDSQVYSTSATYYFTSHVGVGVDISYVDGDDIDSTSYGISGEWFITENFAIRLSYVRTEIDESISEFAPVPYRGGDFTSSTVFEEASNNDADIDTFSIGAKLRF